MRIKIKKYLNPTKLLALVGLFVLVIFSHVLPVAAQATFTQSYGSDQVLQRGMIVRLVEEDTTKVEALAFAEMEQMYGVVVHPNDAPVTLSSEGQKVFVATGGKYEILVSSQNGQVNPGDYITISAFNGIGMKAGDAEPIVIGRALSGFNGSDGIISNAQITDSDGSERTVAIGKVSADISISRNPLLKAEEPDVPEILRRASETIAGKEVSALKIYLALTVFVIATIVAGTLMYGGVRSGITSIGRNPLSKKSIIRGMLQVVIVGLIVFISGIFAVYLLLKL